MRPAGPSGVRPPERRDEHPQSRNDRREPFTRGDLDVLFSLTYPNIDVTTRSGFVSRLKSIRLRVEDVVLELLETIDLLDGQRVVRRARVALVDEAVEVAVAARPELDVLGVVDLVGVEVEVHRAADRAGSTPEPPGPHPAGDRGHRAIGTRANPPSRCGHRPRARIRSLPSSTPGPHCGSIVPLASGLASREAGGLTVAPAQGHAGDRRA